MVQKIGVLMVLLYYLWAHFEGDEKSKGGPLEIEIFFVEGVIEKGWRLIKHPRLF